MATKDERYTPVAPGIFKVIRRGRFVGYRAFVWVVDRTRPKGGRNVPKRFRKSTTLTAMKDWREDQRRLAKLTPRREPISTPITDGFAGDATRYLETVKAMPSISDRRLHIQDWIAVFAGKMRGEITSAMIRAQRDRWLTTGPRRERQRTAKGWRWVLVPKPLSPGSVNRRLRALENLWTVLDGSNAPNPVREVPECDEPAPSARGTTFAIIQEILDHMPERTRGTAGVKGSRDGPSKTRARIAVEMWTGLAHSQLAKLTSKDVDFASMTYFRPRRQKGRRGKRNRPVRPESATPLLPQASAALKHFFAIGANGPFSRSSLHSSFRRGIQNANAARLKQHRQAKRKDRPDLIPPTLRPYDVKHTFGGEAYLASQDLRAVQELLGLSRLELADRYAYAAVAPAAAVAAGKLARRGGETSPATLTTRKKVRKYA